jgi:HPt (histidine-containing phosphotransfer) domain-containing protein
MTAITRPLDIIAVAAFSEEVRSSEPRILAALDEAQREGAPSPAAHEAFRLIHALKGAASMVGLAALGHLLNLAEELLDLPVNEGRPVPDDVLALLRLMVPKFPAYVDAAAAASAPTASRSNCRAPTGFRWVRPGRAERRCST